MKLFKIETGNFMLDGGAMFGVVPKSLWEKVYPADEKNLCNLSLRCLLVQTADRLLLINTGIGSKQSEKFFSYYYLNGEATLEQSLAACGFRAQDITDVLVTHLHFDHVGGAVSLDHQNLIMKPAFPNATYWVSLGQWQWARHPNRRERASFLEENYLPLEEKGVLRFLEKEGDFLPEIDLRFFNGHTRDLIVPVIEYRGKKLIYISDLVPTSAHVPAAWVCGYDTRPLLSLEEREAFLQEAYEHGSTLFFEHDLYSECCNLRETEKGIKAGSTFTLDDFLNRLN